MAEFLNENIKFLRNSKGISQQGLADKVGIDRSTISRIENDEIDTTIDNAIKIANALDVGLFELVSKDLRFDNANIIDIDSDVIKIPVLGIIKAGIPIEAQEEIIDYVEIPKKWTLGGKKFYGLKISGDSMYPKYQEDDIVIFEQNEDKEQYNNKDCAVMVNGDDATFKQVLLNEQGLVLRPYNNAYDIMMYSNDDIEKLPIKIVGIAREKRTKL